MTLLSALHNNRNVTLMAPRRMGKTGLIHHLFNHIHEAEPEAACFYIDIFSTKNLEQMVQKMGEAIMGKIDSPVQSVKRNLEALVRNCRSGWNQPPCGPHWRTSLNTLRFPDRPAISPSTSFSR